MAEEQDRSVPAGLQVSAILVAFNQETALHRAVEALEKSNNREKMEILVVDCGSDDRSATIDADFPSVNMLRLPHHLGAARAMNIATRTAKGELLMFLSPNVEVMPDTIPSLAAKLEDDAGAVAACPLLTDAEGKPVSKIHRIPTRDDLTSACKGGELPAVSVDPSQDVVTVEYPGMDALMVRKLFVRGMNFFDERFGHYWADADLAAQVRRAGKKIRLFPKIRAIYHSAPDPLEGDPLARVDRITGAAALLSKYGGGGFGFKLGAAFSALGRADLGGFSKVLSGEKLDGSQAG